MTQSMLNAKSISKKRPKADSDDDEGLSSSHADSLLSATPPSAKKQKKAQGLKKVGAKPLREIENEAISEAIDASMVVDGATDTKAKKGSKATEQYQKARL